MKKHVLKSIGILLCLISLNSKAQTYSAWGHAVNETGHMYDTVNAGGDSLKFTFTNTQGIAYGNPRLIIYFEGNFGDWFDYMDVFDENLYYYGGTYSNYGYDCAPEDSTVLNLSTSDVNSWVADNQISFTCISYSGPGTCGVSRVRARLQYDYCVSGLPTQYATASASNAFLCPTDAPVTLSGTPANGTFSGAGVTGTSFSPANLSTGGHIVYYTATDGSGCTTTGSTIIYVKPMPVINGNAPVYACIGSTAALTATNVSGSVLWFSDAALTQSVASGNTYTTPALTHTTSYWVAGVDFNSSLDLDTVTDGNFAIVDVNGTAGDDRGGIAITKTHVYYNGDQSAVRFDLNLTPGSVTMLPIRDGMFSDLRTGKLWSLYNTTGGAPIGSYLPQYNVDALRGLDSNLAFTNEYIYLSQTIDMGNYNETPGIFAGAGVVGLYSGDTQHFYAVDLDNGFVTDVAAGTAELEYSENWCAWGVMETSCSGGYSVIYRDYNDDDIHRRDLSTGNVTSVGTFAGLSDMATLTVDPWNNRWYFHHENSSATFGGNSETLGYADAVLSTSLCPGSGFGCSTEVTVNTPADVIFPALPSANVCLNNDAVELNSATPAGGVYSGIGVGTNVSGTVFSPALAGQGTYLLTYSHTDAASGCADAATQTITVNTPPTITAVASHSAICLGTNETVSLTADGAGASGTYSWTGSLGNDAVVTLSPLFDQTYTVSATDENGCQGSASVQLFVSNCVGIKTISANTNNLSIYPNPSNGEFTISSDQTITLTIVNELGQHVKVISLTAASHDVKVSDLSNGVYFITGVNANGSVKQKIVIAK